MPSTLLSCKRTFSQGSEGLHCARHRLTDVVRDTLTYETIEDMYGGLSMIDKELQSCVPVWQVSALGCMSVGDWFGGPSRVDRGVQ